MLRSFSAESQGTIADFWHSLTRYNLVISVLSVFLLIVKFPVHCMHLLYPPFATLAHGAVFVLYIVSARFQGGSDMSDPKQPQPGPPWYITKSCSAAAPSAHIGYCQQAKALFAITIITLYESDPSTLANNSNSVCTVCFTSWNSVSPSTPASSPKKNVPQSSKSEKRGPSKRNSKRKS